MNIPWLTVLWVLPVVGGVVVALLPRRASNEAPKLIALGFSVVTLVLTVALALDYKSGGGRQFTEEVDWIKLFGAHYALGIDGLGLTLVLLTAILAPVVVIASWHDGDALHVRFERGHSEICRPERRAEEGDDDGQTQHVDEFTSGNGSREREDRSPADHFPTRSSPRCPPGRRRPRRRGRRAVPMA